MKTAMQQHIEWLEGIRNKLIKSGDIGGSLDITDYILNAQSLLEKEKEQMKDAFIKGSLSWATGTNSEQYYSETYGDDK